MTINTQQIVSNFIAGVSRQVKREDAELNNLKRLFDAEFRNINQVLIALVDATNANHFADAKINPPVVTYDLANGTAEARFDVNIFSERKTIRVAMDGQSMSVGEEQIEMGVGRSPYPLIMDTFRTWLQRRTVTETLS